MRLINRFLTKLWYRESHFIFYYGLLPFSVIFALIVVARKFCYEKRIKKSQKFSVPIIVVGNITVGGTGKTPLVIYLFYLLKNNGYRPGIVMRGVGSRLTSETHQVTAEDSAEKVGDEALVLFAGTQGAPIVLGKKRVAAVQQLLNNNRCDVVISDDGLQHYALARDIEIAVLDGHRRFGNKTLLPSGPLREPKSRLKTVDFVVVNGGATKSTEYDMQIKPLQFVNVVDATKTLPLDYFANKKIHAVAGIGNPERFFATLKKLNIDIIAHAFPDHYVYQAKDLCFDDHLPVLMTEKDAVKCNKFEMQQGWYLQITVELGTAFNAALQKKLLLLL